jgi:hypothetical protein
MTMDENGGVSRRDWLKVAGAAGLTAASAGEGGPSLAGGTTSEVTNIGGRRELFVDTTLVGDIKGHARLQLNQPTPQEVTQVNDRPWEGASCAYMKVFRDGDLYRMYYRGSDVIYTEKGYSSPHPEVACYAESTDGVHWVRPELGLFEFGGSKKNNIIWMGEGSHNFAPFLDENPACPANEKFKALAGSFRKGLWAYVSADGKRFRKIQEKAVIAKGAFDSLNLAFWDSLAGVYREFHRDFRKGRDIRTATSQNFVDWSESRFLDYTPQTSNGLRANWLQPVKDDDPDNKQPGRVSQLYTNQVIPYYRAPHIYLGFPTRYIDRGWSYSATQLPRYEYRKLRGAKFRREGTAVTDGMFMTSRDATSFRVWPESFIRPGLRSEQSWFYGDAYQNHGLVETASQFEDGGNDLSVYVSEYSHQNRPGQFRRYTLRIDGFVSLTAPLEGGELVTTPIRFQGNRLSLNTSTSAAGSVRVGIEDADGKPVPGYSIEEAHPLYGDSLDLKAAWKARGADVGVLAGKTVRLRFRIQDADVYSYRFESV